MTRRDVEDLARQLERELAAANLAREAAQDACNGMVSQDHAAILDDLIAQRDAANLARERAEQALAESRRQLAALEARCKAAEQDAARWKHVRLGQWRCLAEWNHRMKQYDALCPERADARADAALAQAQASTEKRCPFPWTGDDGTASQCIERKHCGCDEEQASGPTSPP